MFSVSSEGIQRLCVNVFVEDDDRVEDVETFHLEISTRVPRIRITQNMATVRIQDDDMVAVDMTSRELSVDEGGVVSVCVSRSGVIEKTVTVDLSLEPRSAQGIYTSSFVTLTLSSSLSCPGCDLFALPLPCCTSDTYTAFSLPAPLTHTLPSLSLQPDLISPTSTFRSSSLRRPWPSETSAATSPPVRTT